MTLTPAPVDRRRQTWTLIVVCIATFMLLLDVTIVSVALASIQDEFDADLADLQWVIDAYALPLAGLLLTAATLGDRLGRRRVFLVGMAIFTIGSVACALATSVLVLDLTRALQGVGGALLFAVGLPLIGAAFPDPKQRAGAIGAFGATLAAATAVGPLVGGALVDGPGWRWIFLVNIPIGIATGVLAATRLTESKADRPRAADWVGTVLLSTGLVALVLAFIRGNPDGWASGRVLGLFAGAAVLLVGFVVWELRTPEPMLDLGLFRRPSFTAVTVGAFAISGTLIASTSYLALYLQNTLGYSPFQAGLRFLPLTLAAFVAAPVAARLQGRVPLRVLVGGSLALAAIGTALLSRLDGDSDWTGLVVGFVVAGIGLGISSAALSSAALAAVEPARAGMATGAVNTARQVGLAAGVAILGAIFQRTATADAADSLADTPLPADAAAGAAEAIGSGAGVRVAQDAPEGAGGLLAEVARSATAAGLDDMLLSGAVLAAAASVLAFAVIRSPAPRPGS